MSLIEFQGKAYRHEQFDVRRVLRHFGAEPFGVGKVRDRTWMPDGQITDQLGQSAKRRLHNHIDSAASDRIAILATEL